MRWLRFALLILFVTVLQTSLLDIIGVTTLNIKPNLLLILLVFFAIHCSDTEVVITSFTIGFAADIIGSSMGPQIISFGLFGTLLADLRHVIGILAFFLTFLKAEPAPSNIYTQLFWTPLYSAIVGPFLFLPSDWWMRIRKRRTKRF
jgi:rod shape-determining protein MreD